MLLDRVLTRSLWNYDLIYFSEGDNLFSLNGHYEPYMQEHLRNFGCAIKIINYYLFPKFSSMVLFHYQARPVHLLPRSIRCIALKEIHLPLPITNIEKILPLSSDIKNSSGNCVSFLKNKVEVWADPYKLQLQWPLPAVLGSALCLIKNSRISKSFYLSTNPHGIKNLGIRDTLKIIGE